MDELGLLRNSAWSSVYFFITFHDYHLPELSEIQVETHTTIYLQKPEFMHEIYSDNTCK